MSACEDACTPGETRCSPEGVQQCRKDTSDCGVWSPAMACPQGTQCLGNACMAEACEPKCMAGQRRCDGPALYSVCEGQCGEWARPMACPSGQMCSGGNCVGEGAQCMNSCDNGAITCVDSGSFQRCERQATGCLDYSVRQNCPQGQRCTRGQGCVSACAAPQCNAGETRCFQNGLQRCVSDRDGCLVWGAIESCPNNSICQNNMCAQGCQAECSPGQRRCQGDGIQVCENRNGCATWGSTSACPGGTQCRGAGACGTCQNGERESRPCTLC